MTPKNPKTNPFAAFAAGSTSKGSATSGWMSVKKRGRDDAVIERDKRRAKEARKQQKQQTRSNKTPAAKKTKKKTVGRIDSEDDDDEIDDEDDFIVEDDDSNDWSEHDDDDEDLDESLIVPRAKRGAVAKSPKWIDDNDDEFIDTPKSQKKSRRPDVPDDDEEEEEAEFQSDGDDEIDIIPSKNRSKFFPKSATTTPEESNDDDDDAPTSRRARARETMKAAKQKKKTVILEDDDSDSELDIWISKSQKSKSKPGNGTSATGSETKPAKRFKKKQTAPLEVDTDDEGVFSPLQKSKLVSSTESSKSTVSFFKDTKRLQNVKNKGKEKKKKHKTNHDDEDEEIALALALSESQASYQNEQKTAVKKQKLVYAYSDDDEEEPLMEEKEDEDEDDFDGAHVGETQDERQAAAAKVLEMANELSRQVLQNMISWNCGATSGMIVDGALGLYNVSSNQATAASWISEDQLKEILPTVKLAEYQVIGVNWLALLHNMRVNIGEKTNVNGILADVMGLGKTVQTIAFLAWLRSRNRSEGKTEVVKPHIIIVPASVLDNWMGEFKKFAPQLQVVKYHGSMADRESMKYDLERRLPHRKKGKVNDVTGDIDVLLTTFSYFSGNKADDRSFLRKFDYDYMVVDEAHCLKNPDSKAYQNLDKMETAHRLLLTGTPVQNSPKELMSLICFLMPLFKTAGSIWDDEDGKTNDGGARMLDYFVSIEGGDASSDEAAYRKLKQLFAPFVLRRRKEDVLAQAMPKKTREVIRVPLTPEMRTLYDSILATHLQGKADKVASIPGNASNRLHLFSALRKVANHPLLLRNRHTDDVAIHHLATHLRMYGYFGQEESCTLALVKKEVESMSDFNVHHAALELVEENPTRRSEMKRYMLEEKDLFCSPKLERLRTLIPELVEKGHRLLIFSQWTSCLDLLGCLLESLDLRFFRLDGQTQISTRQDMIDEFNKDKSIPVFLLSTKAGGMGINLTAADVCILHDLDFNPFNDLQAEDRCHRIGQTKPVRVIKMVTMDTVDDDIYEMQQRKTKMNAAILEKGGTISAAEEKKKDNDEIKSMLQNQLDRYLQSSSSSKKGKAGGGGIDKFFATKED